MMYLHQGTAAAQLKWTTGRSWAADHSLDIPVLKNTQKQTEACTESTEQNNALTELSVL